MDRGAPVRRIRRGAWRSTGAHGEGTGVSRQQPGLPRAGVGPAQRRLVKAANGLEHRLERAPTSDHISAEGSDMSDERTAAVNDPQRLPSRAELAALLDRYFAGPIDDAIVNRLESQCHELWADPSRRDAEEAAFRGNGLRYFGQAWKELV